MSNALSVISLLIALAALAVSLSQTRLAQREAGRAQPNVSISCAYTDRLARGNGEYAKAVLVTLNNVGREETEVASLVISSEMAVINGMNCLFDDGGPSIPHRLPGHSRVSWMVKADVITADIVEVHVHLGHGKVLVGTARKNDAS